MFTCFIFILCISTVHKISRFRVSFNIIFCAFLAFSSLGAGLVGKRTRKPLGAHQEKILIAIKENTAVLIVQTKLQTVYNISCVGKFNIIRLFTSIASLHSRRFTPIHLLTPYFAPRNKKNLTPKKRTNSYCQNEEILRWRTASTSIKFGQNDDRATAST
jgi:hypothetical protein